MPSLSNIFVLLLMFMVKMSYPTANICEIINNTDINLEVTEPLITISSTYKSFNNIQIFSTFIETGQKLAPIIVNRGHSLSFLPKTKNIVTGLEIPKTGVDMKGNLFSLRFSTFLDSSSKVSLLAFRQFGDLFQITERIKRKDQVRDMIINESKINVYAEGSFRHTTGIKIADDTCFSIEIKQVVPKVFGKNPSGFDFIIKNIPTPKKELLQFATHAKAVIKQFTPGTLTSGVANALISFEKQTTATFFQNFLKMLLQDEYLRGIATLRKVDDRSQEISFQFYTDMTRNDLQKLLDKFNIASEKIVEEKSA